MVKQLLVGFVLRLRRPLLGILELHLRVEFCLVCHLYEGLLELLLSFGHFFFGLSDLLKVLLFEHLLAMRHSSLWILSDLELLELLGDLAVHQLCQLRLRVPSQPQTIALVQRNQSYNQTSGFHCLIYY